jgi:hypothetical protein
MDSTELIKEALESYNNYPIDKHCFERKYDKKSYLAGYYDARLKVSRVDVEVKVNFAELESIQYLNKMRELINLGDGINVNARLLILRRKIIDDIERITKSKISA